MRIASSSVQLNSRATSSAELATSTRVAVTAAPNQAQLPARTERRDDGDRFERQGASPERTARRIGKLLDKLDRLAGRLENGENVQGKIEKVLDKLERLMQRNTAPAQIAYDRTTSYREQQTLQFAASGSVTTADGQSYDFQAKLDLARLFARTETISLRIGAAAPAAVTPGAATPAAVTPAAGTTTSSQPATTTAATSTAPAATASTATKPATTTPAAGTTSATPATSTTASATPAATTSTATPAVSAANSSPKAPTTPATTTPAAPPVTVSALALGNAVLGYDRNQDNTIDPASELVGGSGNGFADLAALDGDGNGWIDEGDAAFSSLRLVTSNAGTLASQSLAAAGVGAIFTGSVATPFTYTSSNNTAEGYLQRAGTYLSEAGVAGVVRQVDVLV